MLREKSLKLTGFLRFLLESRLAEQVSILTPKEIERSGSQLSLAINLKPGDSDERGKQVFDTIERNGVTCDWRYPNVIRVAPVPLYNNFSEAFRFVELLENAIKGTE